MSTHQTMTVIYPFVWGLTEDDKKPDLWSRNACWRAADYITVKKPPNPIMVNLCGRSPNCPHQVTSISQIMAVEMKTYPHHKQYVRFRTMEEVESVYGRDEELYALAWFIMEQDVKDDKFEVILVVPNHWNIPRLWILSRRMKKLLSRYKIHVRVGFLRTTEWVPLTWQYFLDEVKKVLGEIIRPFFGPELEVRYFGKISPFWRKQKD